MIDLKHTDFRQFIRSKAPTAAGLFLQNSTLIEGDIGEDIAWRQAAQKPPKSHLPSFTCVAVV